MVIFNKNNSFVFIVMIMLVGCSVPQTSEPPKDFLSNMPTPTAGESTSIININPDFNMNKGF